MSKTLEQVEQELDAKIPRSAVRERDGGGGRKLSYLEGHYVIDRLNKIFGPLGWSKEIAEIKEVVSKTPRGEFPAYLVKVILSIHGKDNYRNVVKEAYGYGADKSGQNAHELAMKEAVTDALKVAAKDLGMSLGLALYDKTQENVDDNEEPKAQHVSPPNSARSPSVESPAREATSGQAPADKLKLAIRSHVKAAIKKGVTSTEAIKAHLKGNYAADSLDGVGAPEDLQAILDYVRKLTA